MPTNKEIDSLLSDLGIQSGKATASISDKDIDGLLKDLKLDTPAEASAPAPELSKSEYASQHRRKVEGSVVQGFNDVINTVGRGIGAVDEALFRGGADRNRLFKKRVEEENKAFKAKYGEEDTIANVGRTAGQIATTAPLTPTRAIQGAYGAAKAGAPLLNRLGAYLTNAGVGGGIFGGLTSSSNEKGVILNTAEGAAGGLIAAPVVAAGGALGSKAIQTARNVWAHIDMAKIANQSGLPLSSVKTIVQKFEEIGMTPSEVQKALAKLGPRATIMDLDEALLGSGAGLAKSGGKPTSIMKSRMEERASTANSEVVQELNSRFGPKPDVYVEGGKLLGKEAENIHKEAQRLTASDYAAAHASPDRLGISGIVGNIEDKLEKSVGAEAKVLKEVKSYFYRSEKDAEGNVVKVLKDDVASLHAIRQGIDDIINKQGDKLPPNASRAVNTVREHLDTILKTNPQMAAADAKFAEKMKIKEGLTIGHNSIAKGTNKEEFIRTFDAATPEVKETIKKGMLAAVHNIMEKSAQGELSAAGRLFEKKSVNREIFKHVFGKDAETTLENIHRDLAFRHTEREVIHGSRTAENQMAQAAWGLRPKEQGAFTEGLKNAGMDVLAGTSGALSVGRGIVAAGRNRLIRYSEGRHAQMLEGAADVMSRVGATRDRAIQVSSQIKAIQDGVAAKNSKKSILRLPVTANAPIGNLILEEGKNRFK